MHISDRIVMAIVSLLAVDCLAAPRPALKNTGAGGAASGPDRNRFEDRRTGPAAPLVNGWEPVGLAGGGGMFKPAISRADPRIMLINCDMSGCYMTTDGGRFWKLIPYRERRSNTRCKPAFHPTDPRIILAPEGYGGKLKISRDQGQTWQWHGALPGPAHGEIAYDPDYPERLAAGLVDGIAISSDGGRTWRKVRGPRGPALAVHFDRTSPARARRIFAATTRGIWRSDDGGKTWNEKTRGLPWKEIYSFAGASNPTTGVIMLYCSVPSRIREGRLTGGVYRSSDRGETWERAMGRGINQDTTPADRWAGGPIAQYRHVLAADANPLTVYAANSSTGFHPPHHETVFRSDDGGRTWRDTLFLDPRFKRYNVTPNYVTATAGQSYKGGNAPFDASICPGDPRHLILTWSNCFITHDGGDHWLSGHALPAPGQTPGPGSAWVCNGLVVTTTWHYYVDPFEPNRHYICYTDIGMARSLDAGRTWIWWEKKKWAPWRNTCYELAFDPAVPGKIWGAFSNVHDIPNGNIIHNRHWGGNPERGPGGVCISTDFGETWRPVTQGLPEAPVTSIVVDPRSPPGARTLYAGVFGKGVYKSVDDGKTWRNVSRGLGAPGVNMRVCRVLLHRDGTLFALITAKRDIVDRRFRAEGVGLYRSIDGGTSWQRITNAPVLLWPKDVSVHPGDSRIIFIGATRAGDHAQEGLYRTMDGGKTWKRVARFGREHFGAYFHPEHPRWVYATMCEGRPEYSLWLSTDLGDTWKPFRSFPFSNTQRVTVDPGNPEVIYVTTFGASVLKGPATPRE